MRELPMVLERDEFLSLHIIIDELHATKWGRNPA